MNESVTSSPENTEEYFSFIPLERNTNAYGERANKRREEAAKKAGVEIPDDAKQKLSTSALLLNLRTAKKLENSNNYSVMTAILENMVTEYGNLYPNLDKGIVISLAFKARDHISDYLARANRMDLVEKIHKASEDWKSVASISKWIEEEILSQYPEQKQALIEKARDEFVDDIYKDLDIRED